MSVLNEAAGVNVESQAPPGERLAGQLVLGSIVGRWTNTNRATRGIAEIRITAERDELRVRVFGAGANGAVDWGERPAVTYAYQVTGEVVAGFELTYDFGTQETLVTAIHNRGVLVIHAYHRCKDGRGRSNFISKEFFHQ